jgi:hypothetical protein
MKERNHVEDLSVHGTKKIRTNFKQSAWDGVDKIHLAQDSEHWRAAGNRKIEQSGSIKCGEFLDKLR